MSAVLTISNLSKKYGQRSLAFYALHDVNLEIEQGSFTAIVGRSGSGKTTLLNIIGGLEVPTEGRVEIQNQDLYALKDAARAAFRRQHIGYIFQFFNLLSELTVQENIYLPAYLDHQSPNKHFIRKITRQLGLQDKLDKYPAELSGGEQQRTAVARALSTKPDIILADEPTGNLDRKSGDELMELLNFSHQFFEQTILMVTHDLDIARTAQRVITLEDGKIVADFRGSQL